MLGSLALIDEGETDHKIIVVRDSDSKYAEVASVAGALHPHTYIPLFVLTGSLLAVDLDKIKPNTVNKLIDWLKNYKTSDGKPGTLRPTHTLLASTCTP